MLSKPNQKRPSPHKPHNRPNPPAIHHPIRYTPHPPHLEKTQQKPRKLTLTQALTLTLIYHRQRPHHQLIAEFFNVSQPTVSRTINRREKALVKIHEAADPVTETSTRCTRFTGKPRNTRSRLELAYPLRKNKLLR
ncbi:transposase family protein [Rothia sp. ZJ932]|uniref:transposase family protein n=1 Tax=Rothia sp. ZJ932 TaxID=2810516 RepID=UPI001966FA69|nr:transposase family protein [Rothia sp. ZJ932]